jgi:hypothetical protein
MKSSGIHAGSVLALVRAALCLALCSAVLPAQQPGPAAKGRLDSDPQEGPPGMELLAGGKVIRTYKVALGQGGLAPKERQGDGRTPEGHYVIEAQATLRANTTRLCASPIPTPRTASERRSLGVSPGGSILIHGLPNGKGYIGAGAPALRLDAGLHRRHRRRDRRDLFVWFAVGTPVEIRP